VLAVLVEVATAVLQEALEPLGKLVAVVAAVVVVEETLLVVVPVDLVELEYVLLLMILFDFFPLKSHN
jgi:predicted lipoprotein